MNCLTCIDRALPLSCVNAGSRVAGTLLLGLTLLVTPVLVGADGIVAADDQVLERGLLDTIRLPSSHTLGTEAPVAPAQLPIAELKKERTDLKQLGDSNLQNRAEQGDRSAQLVLAERFANEAETLAFVPIAANSALSDAVYWYSTAASRGFPGAASVDRTFPLFPVRAFRSGSSDQQ